MLRLLPFCRVKRLSDQIGASLFKSRILGGIEPYMTTGQHFNKVEFQLDQRENVSAVLEEGFEPGPTACPSLSKAGGVRRHHGSIDVRTICGLVEDTCRGILRESCSIQRGWCVMNWG